MIGYAMMFFSYGRELINPTYSAPSLVDIGMSTTGQYGTSGTDRLALIGIVDMLQQRGEGGGGGITNSPLMGIFCTNTCTGINELISSRYPNESEPGEATLCRFTLRIHSFIHSFAHSVS